MQINYIGYAFIDEAQIECIIFQLNELCRILLPFRVNIQVMKLI